MTRVNVSSVTNTVVVPNDVNGVVVVTENGTSTVVSVPQTSTVTAITAGPQGPQGTPGPGGLVVNTAAKVDKSIVYYDGSTNQFVADSVWTASTLTDGGNF